MSGPPANHAQRARARYRPHGDDATHEAPLDVQPDGEWHVIEVAIDPAALIANGLRANQLMPYVQLAQPSSGKTRLEVDDPNQTVRAHTWVAK